VDFQILSHDAHSGLLPKPTCEIILLAAKNFSPIKFVVFILELKVTAENLTHPECKRAF